MVILVSIGKVKWCLPGSRKILYFKKKVNAIVCKLKEENNHTPPCRKKNTTNNFISILSFSLCSYITEITLHLFIFKSHLIQKLSGGKLRKKISDV